MTISWPWLLATTHDCYQQEDAPADSRYPQSAQHRFSPQTAGRFTGAHLSATRVICRTRCARSDDKSRPEADASGGDRRPGESCSNGFRRDNRQEDHPSWELREAIRPSCAALTARAGPGSGKLAAERQKIGRRSCLRRPQLVALQLLEHRREGARQCYVLTLTAPPFMMPVRSSHFAVLRLSL
jgi:hypothetical protein